MGWIDDQDFMDLDEREDADANPPRELRCRDCGSEDVYWYQDRQGRWVLYGLDSRRHVCKNNVVTALRLDAFEDIDN
jgi:hypothetical protein